MTEPTALMIGVGVVTLVAYVLAGVFTVVALADDTLYGAPDGIVLTAGVCWPLVVVLVTAANVRRMLTVVLREVK